MIDFEKMRQQKTVVIFSQRIAEKLVFRYGLRNLIAIDKSNRVERKRVYVFYNFPELVDEFQQMIEDLAFLNNERRNVETEYYNILESSDEEPFEEPEPDIDESVVEPESIVSVDDMDIIGEQSSLPKKRGRKKKEVVE